MQQKKPVQQFQSREFSMSGMANSMPRHRVGIPVRVDRYHPADTIDGVPVRQPGIVVVNEAILNDPRSGPIHEMIRQQRRFP